MAQKRRKLTPEILVPRLGEYLVQQGHITEADLEKALAYQREKAKAKKHCLLGRALLDLRLIKRGILDTAITEQIIQLRTALENANRNLEQRVEERTEELQEALRKLSELNQMKANFVANISHELRTPMTHVKGYLELLVSESLGSISEEQKSALQVTQRAAGRLESLIESLIMFSLAARGEMTLNLQTVDMNKIAEEVFNFSKPKAEDRNVVLHYDVRAGLPRVQADEEKISWTILQLMDNAIKFTPAEGHVTLAIEPETDKLIRVSVTDTGIGIPNERVEEIFEPFHQLDSSPRRRYGGTGIGLSLIQQILNAHGSIVEVETEKEKGSTFRFRLIASDQPAQ
jgi:signal transduction histidine kinase